MSIEFFEGYTLAAQLRPDVSIILELLRQGLYGGGGGEQNSFKNSEIGANKIVELVYL
jgi:hypothetical protein